MLDIQGPYILVGNAFGGDNVRTFAARYPAEVAGLVLVEADIVSSPEERRGHAKLIASMRECRDAIAAGKPLPQAPAGPDGAGPQLCAGVLLPGPAGTDVVGGAQRQAARAGADQGCDLRQLHLGDGTNAGG